MSGVLSSCCTGLHFTGSCRAITVPRRVCCIGLKSNFLPWPSSSLMEEMSSVHVVLIDKCRDSSPRSDLTVPRKRRGRVMKARHEFLTDVKGGVVLFASAGLPSSYRRGDVIDRDI